MTKQRWGDFHSFQEWQKEWDEACMHHYKRTLPITPFSHYCLDWDFLPIDETCAEFLGCACFAADNPAVRAACDKLEEQQSIFRGQYSKRDKEI